MEQLFNDIRKKMHTFVETGEDTHFNSAINNLSCELINAIPAIAGVKYPIEELQSYSNKLYVANSDDIQKYYQLSLSQLNALETIINYKQ